jgi:hypothetical protein
MSKLEAKKIVRNYAKKLREENYPFSAIYLVLTPKAKRINGAILMWQ